MGDSRFEEFYARLRTSARPLETVRELADDEAISALAACARREDALLANVLATELHNRLQGRARFELGLLQEAELRRVMLDGLGDAVLSTDPDGRVVRAFGDTVRVLGRGQTELVNAPEDAIIHPDDRRALGEARSDVVQTGAERRVRYRILFEGGERAVEAVIRPLDLQVGHTHGTVETIRPADEERPPVPGS